jgi:6-phosphogluconolactonase (cycloisomerase 2 family)
MEVSHMHSLTRLFSAGALAVAAFGVLAQPAFAQGRADHHARDQRAVFVPTNEATGNNIVAYDRGSDGNLTFAASFATGGQGGSLGGAAVDKLASQGSLTYDSSHHMLYAVNAGSNTVSVFRADGSQLSLRQVISSGGTFPVSVAAYGNLVYVLNARSGGTLQGFRVDDGHLRAIRNSNRSLGLAIITGGSEFLNTPGQVSFTPDGAHLIVTTKANGSHIDVFGVGHDGRVSDSFVANSSTTPVPFGIALDAAGHLAIAQAGGSTVATYDVNADSTISPIATLADGQAALCWIAAAVGSFYVANAGGDGTGMNGSISGYRVDSNGQLTVFTTSFTDKGATDLTVSPDGGYLYADTGASGIVDGFAINSDGTLHALTPVSVPGGADLEGIVAI